MNDSYKKSKFYEKLNFSVIEFVKNNSKVLDVGCNTGKMGEYLIRHKNCVVFGVDIFPEAIERAKSVLTAAEVMDLEKGAFPFKGDTYDVIIFADVLEHLYDPLSVLKTFKFYLKPEGYIITSVPNIAFLVIRLKLLLGKWNYKSYGILDNTHVRFFTFKTMAGLFQKTGLRIESKNCVAGVFLRDNFFDKLLNNICKGFCKIFPNLFATQFVFKLIPE